MHEEIARDAGSIVLPFAPLEKAFTRERTLRRGSEKARPIAGFGGGVKGNGVVPGAEGGVPIPIGTDHVELADSAGGEQLFCLGVDDGADTLAADLKDAVRGADGIDNLRTIGVDVNHRLFAIDILAVLHAVDFGILVPSRRRTAQP